MAENTNGIASFYEYALAVLIAFLLAMIYVLQVDVPKIMHSLGELGAVEIQEVNPQSLAISNSPVALQSHTYLVQGDFITTIFNDAVFKSCFTSIATVDTKVLQHQHDTTNTLLIFADNTELYYLTASSFMLKVKACSELVYLRFVSLLDCHMLWIFIFSVLADAILTRRIARIKGALPSPLKLRVCGIAIITSIMLNIMVLTLVLTHHSYLFLQGGASLLLLASLWGYIFYAVRV